MRLTGSELDRSVLARRGQHRLDDVERGHALRHGDVALGHPAHGVTEVLLLQGQRLALGDRVADDVALQTPAS